jgi:hypothetical protein
MTNKEIADRLRAIKVRELGYVQTDVVIQTLADTLDEAEAREVEAANE